MFRCVSKLKGLIIDIDSFSYNDFDIWDSLCEKYACVFIRYSSSPEHVSLKKDSYRGQRALLLPGFKKHFEPERSLHMEALNCLSLQSSEVAYISADHSFIINALKFLSGTIWVHKRILTYQEASFCPDLICSSLDKVENILEKEIDGLHGEIFLTPDYYKKRQGYFLSIKWCPEDEKIPLFTAGRYFSYSHYMSQLHPFSSGVFLNKSVGKPYYGVLNSTFVELYSSIIRRIAETSHIDCICRVPARPNKEDRFQLITNMVSQSCKLEDISSRFRCTSDFVSQKGLSAEDRYINVRDVFQYSGNIENKSVILLDDIITTGSTVRACAEELKKQGAAEVIVLVLAINQLSRNYWSSSYPCVVCPICGANMILLLNSQSKEFFYMCLEKCQASEKAKTLNYNQGRTQLINFADNEFAFSAPVQEDTLL